MFGECDPIWHTEMLRETWRMECAWKSIELIQNMCIGSDTLFLPESTADGRWRSLFRTGRHTCSLTCAAAEAFQGFQGSQGRRGAVDGLHPRQVGVLRLVRVDSSVGEQRLLVRHDQQHLLLIILWFNLHHPCALLWADGWYIPVESQDDKLEQHPQQAHEDLRVRREKMKQVFKY